MKPQEFADIHAYELARHGGRAAPRNPENFQTRYASECDEARQLFDDLVAGRECVEWGDMYFQRVFRPIDLGKFVVGRARPHLFAQLSLEETRKYSDPEKVTNRQRVIQVFPETAETLPTESGWSYAHPSGANPYKIGGFIGGKISLRDSRRRATPTSLANLKEFKDTLGYAIEAAIRES